MKWRKTMNSVLFLGGVAVGVVLDRILIRAQDTKAESPTRVLEECFGAPVWADTFTIKDVRDWVKAREEQLTGHSKAIVLKANEDTLKSIGKEIHIGSSVKKFIILAVYDEAKNEVATSSLIKYGHLDDQLEAALANGNGSMVIEGER
jgi:hypothetical protein